jgi:hypothetical protein
VPTQLGYAPMSAVRWVGIPKRAMDWSNKCDPRSYNRPAEGGPKKRQFALYFKGSQPWKGLRSHNGESSHAIGPSNQSNTAVTLLNMLLFTNIIFRDGSPPEETLINLGSSQNCKQSRTYRPRAPPAPAIVPVRMADICGKSRNVHSRVHFRDPNGRKICMAGRPFAGHCRNIALGIPYDESITTIISTIKQ